MTPRVCFIRSQEIYSLWLVKTSFEKRQMASLLNWKTKENCKYNEGKFHIYKRSFNPVNVHAFEERRQDSRKPRKSVSLSHNNHVSYYNSTPKLRSEFNGVCNSLHWNVARQLKIPLKPCRKCSIFTMKTWALAVLINNNNIKTGTFISFLTNPKQNEFHLHSSGLPKTSKCQIWHPARSFARNYKFQFF